MEKDYAKKSNSSKGSGASRSSDNQSIPKGLIFFTTLLIVGLASLLFFLKYNKKEQNKAVTEFPITLTPTPTPTPTPTIVQKGPVVTIKNKSNNNEIPFHQSHNEMLDKTVEISPEELKLPESKFSYYYLMPCGSFKNARQAEALKAKIAFSGFESSINKIRSKTSLWYRVELGPFESKRKAESVRHRLQDNGLTYCKIWPRRLAR